MSQNPFDALGGGGFDVNALLEQAQAMQQQLQDAQQALAEATVEGTAGGGAVTVVVSGTGDLTEVRIADGTLEGTGADDLAELGDLVVAAYRDAKARADAVATEALGPLAGFGGAGGPAGDAGPGALPGQLGF